MTPKQTHAHCFHWSKIFWISWKSLLVVLILSKSVYNIMGKMKYYLKISKYHFLTKIPCDKH